MKKLTESKTWHLVWGIICALLMVATITVSIVYSIVNAQIIVLIAVFAIYAFNFFMRYKKISNQKSTTEKE